MQQKTDDVNSVCKVGGSSQLHYKDGTLESPSIERLTSYLAIYYERPRLPCLCGLWLLSSSAANPMALASSELCYDHAHGLDCFEQLRSLYQCCSLVQYRQDYGPSVV